MLGEQHLDESARLLANAFRDDPVMHYFYPFDEQQANQCRLALLRFACQVRLDLEWPLIGIVEGTRVWGVAGISAPEKKSWPASLERHYKELEEVVGTEALQRQEAYSDLVDRSRPAEPHYFVGVLGVDPEAQGRGYGRRLLDEAHRMSKSDPQSYGVWLDTENPKNVGFYEHLGYEVVAEVRLEELTIWCLYRLDDSPH
jgi:ribosomal protein S18 acetylase RimI-like enzyme